MQISHGVTKMEIKIRYTYKRKSDSKLYQVIYPLETIENQDSGSFKSMLNNKLWVIIARELFTGVTDKNNSDIFKGDIVKGYIPDSEKDENLELGIIEFKEGSFDIYNPKGEYLGNLSSCTLNKSIELIGDIHNTPELLKVKTK